VQARDEAKIRDHQEKAFGKREFTLSPDPYGSAGVIRGRYDALLEILRCDARSLSHSVRSAVRSLAGDPDLGLAAVPGTSKKTNGKPSTTAAGSGSDHPPH
jgi:hypothetical protein